MEDLLSRAMEMLIGRTHGPLTLRLLLQPSIAVFFAVRAGLRDEKAGRPAFFFWSVFQGSAQRHQVFGEVRKDVGKVFVAALLLDLVYEMIVFRWVYPGQAVIVATILAVIPYLLIRGPVTRLVSRWKAP